MQLQYNAKAAAQGAVPRYSSLIHCIRDTWQVEGMSGLMRGLGPTLARDVPGSAVYYGAYDWYRRMLVDMNGGVGCGPIYCMAGAMSGITAWALLFPVDAVKSLVQSGQYPTWRHAVRDVLKEHGYRGLYRGLTPALVRAIPADAAFFFTAEIVTQWLRGKHGGASGQNRVKDAE